MDKRDVAAFLDMVMHSIKAGDTEAAHVALSVFKAQIQNDPSPHQSPEQQPLDRPKT